MMSGSGWFNCAAHSLPLVRYSHIIRPPYRRRPHIPRRFHQLILPPCLLGSSLPHRHHSSSPHVIIALTRPARRLVRAGSMTGRCYPYRVVRLLWVSKHDGGRAWPCRPCRPCSRLVAGIAIWLSVVIRSSGKQAGNGGDVVHIVHVVRAGSVLIVGRLVQSERTSGASSSLSWGKQAGNGGGAMSSSLRLVRPSRGVRLVSSTLVRLVRRDVGRGVARCRSCGNVGKQAGGGGLGFASSSSLCLFGEHQFDIRIPWGAFIIPVPLPCSR